MSPRLTQLLVCVNIRTTASSSGNGLRRYIIVLTTFTAVRVLRDAMRQLAMSLCVSQLGRSIPIPVGRPAGPDLPPPSSFTSPPAARVATTWTGAVYNETEVERGIQYVLR